MRLCNELASWWPLMSPPAEYTEEAAFYLKAMQGVARLPVQTALELGSGGGHNASHMKHHLREMVLVDVSPGMLAMSHALNPELEHHHGDMRTVRLNRQFDAVFVHDAICYMATESDLRKTFETSFAHCKPGASGLRVSAARSGRLCARGARSAPRGPLSARRLAALAVGSRVRTQGRTAGIDGSRHADARSIRLRQTIFLIPNP
jgi:SAM-dependent methyltransferase